MSLAARRERRSPAAFCDGVWPLIADLSDGDVVTACYIVQEARRGETRNERKPFLRLTLGDRTGSVEAVIWEDADHWEPLCVVETVVGVRGRVGSYNERLQVRIDVVEPLEPSARDLELLLPASPRSREQMERELDERIASIADRGLRKLLQRCLGRGTELGRLYRTHAAAKRNHHAYLGGLLEHSLSVAGVCDQLAEHYAAQGAPLDRDLLIAAALLHDIGKVQELSGFPAPGYTTPGQLLGHILIGLQIVTQQAEAVEELSAGRLLLLQHLIASHQGRPEWDSPRVPMMREAFVLHYADDLDAKLNQVDAVLRDVEPGEWSGYERGLGRSLFRPPATGRPEEAASIADAVIDMFRG